MQDNLDKTIKIDPSNIDSKKIDSKKMKMNIDEIRADIKKYSNNSKDAKLVGVTKYSSEQEMEESYNLGIDIFGENRVQVLVDKIKYFKNNSKKFKDLSWHFIGNLQKNKVKYIIEDVTLIHSVNKISLAKEIDKRARGIDKIQDILLEINIAGDKNKHGYSIEELEDDIEEIKEMKNIRVRGLMAMAPFVEDNEVIRRSFQDLRIFRDEIKKKYFNSVDESMQFTELSMGMTGDYKIALEEGATIIRIGSKIYK